MVVVLFRNVLREDADLAEYGKTFDRMYSIVSQMPGFLAIEGFTSDDGRTHLAVARFESEADVDEWRNQPEHRDAQQRGRKEFYESYTVEVTTQIRERSYSRS